MPITTAGIESRAGTAMQVEGYLMFSTSTKSYFRILQDLAPLDKVEDDQDSGNCKYYLNPTPSVDQRLVFFRCLQLAIFSLVAFRMLGIVGTELEVRFHIQGFLIYPSYLGLNCDH